MGPFHSTKLLTTCLLAFIERVDIRNSIGWITIPLSGGVSLCMQNKLVGVNALNILTKLCMDSFRGKLSWEHGKL